MTTEESEYNDQVINLLSSILDQITVSNNIQERNTTTLEGLERQLSRLNAYLSVPAKAHSVPHSPLEPAAERYNFNSNLYHLDNDSKPKVEDKVVVTHKGKGHFGIIGTVFKATLCYTYLRTSVGESIQKNNDNVAILREKKPARKSSKKHYTY